MNDLIIKDFKGEDVFSFVWRGKVCWIARDIAYLLGYKEASKIISYCIKVEQFERGF